MKQIVSQADEASQLANGAQPSTLLSQPTMGRLESTLLAQDNAAKLVRSSANISIDRDDESSLANGNHVPQRGQRCDDGVTKAWASASPSGHLWPFRLHMRS